MLIKYSQKLLPAQDDTNSTAASTVDKAQVMQEALQTDEWKKTKGEYILSRREKADDFFSGRKKEKKKPRKLEVRKKA